MLIAQEYDSADGISEEDALKTAAVYGLSPVHSPRSLHSGELSAAVAEDDLSDLELEEESDGQQCEQGADDDDSEESDDSQTQTDASGMVPQPEAFALTTSGDIDEDAEVADLLGQGARPGCFTKVFACWLRWDRWVGNRL